MQTHDRLFNKEFRDMMFERKVECSNNPNFSFLNIPTPEIPTMRRTEPKTPLAYIKGVQEPKFDKLNETEVQLAGKKTLYKRKVLSTGEFWVDENGKYVTEEISVPTGSVAILSPIPIGLRLYEEDEKGNRIKVKVSDGFKYVDYIEKEGKRRYIYIIPKIHVYKLSLCALILTPNRHRVFFKGCKLALQSGNYVYLYVIPFTARNVDRGYKILGVKSSFVFDAEVKTLLKYWQETGVMFNLGVTALENPINGVLNLGIIDLDGTCSSDDFVRYDKALADTPDDDLYE